MTEHQKFSQLTKDFSSERKAKIANQAATLKEKEDYHAKSSKV
ncbi:hypothetical protein [Anabaena sp. AL09]|jgi:hypothetical protein|nr:hypothetical protein [Anabaena sp. AL09]